MSRVIVVGMMLAHRLAKRWAGPIDGGNPIIGQRDHHHIKVFLHDLSRMANGEAVIFGCQSLHSLHTRIEADVGRKPPRQGGGQLLDSPVNAVKLHVTRLVHQKVLQAIHGAGMPGFRCHITVNGCLNIAPHGFVSYGTEQVVKGLPGKRIVIVFTPV